MKTLCLTLLIIAAAARCAAAELISYSYDTAGRLTSAHYGDGKTASWQYDFAGNRIRAVESVIIDGDNDGMADAWELVHFKTTDRDGTLDFDNDGASDLAEFLAETLPADANSLLRMHDTVTNNVVQTTVSWSAVIGKRYRVQYKSDLNAPGWNDLPGEVTASASTASKVDTTAVGSARRFYRVLVVQ